MHRSSSGDGELFNLATVASGRNERAWSVEGCRSPTKSFPVVPVDRLDDMLARRQDGLHVLVKNELDFLDGVEVGWVARDNLDRPVLLRHRQADVFAGHPFGPPPEARRRSGRV